MAGRYSAEERIDEVHQRIRQADLSHTDGSARKEVGGDLPGGQDGVPQRERKLGQGQDYEPRQDVGDVGDRGMRQAEADAPPKRADVQLEEDGVCDAEQNDQQGGRVFPVPSSASVMTKPAPARAYPGR